MLSCYTGAVTLKSFKLTRGVSPNLSTLSPLLFYVNKGQYKLNMDKKKNPQPNKKKYPIR